MLNRIHSGLFSAILLLSFFYATSCLKSRKPGLPLKVVHVIQTTGFNRVELTKAIGRYIETPDSNKLQAIYFLIQHMERHYAVVYKVTDSAGNMYHFNPLSYASDSLLFAHWDSLTVTREGFGYQADKYVLDRDTITSEFLIQTVEDAFSLKQVPHLAYIPDEVFFKYVLPYRIGNELIDPWRTTLRPLANLIAEENNQPNADSIALAVNQYVNTHFSFDKRFLKNAFEQHTDTLLLTGTGNDRDLSWLKVKLLRTLGIPATVDYIPYLADSSHSYHFAVYYATDSSFKPLLSKNDEDLLSNAALIPKVYRRVYHQLDSSLFALKSIQKTTPPYLGHYHYLDVTEHYTETKNLVYKGPCPDSIIYISVFNDGKWRAVDWAICKEETAAFKNVGSEPSYQFGFLDNETKKFQLMEEAP